MSQLIVATSPPQRPPSARPDPVDAVQGDADEPFAALLAGLVGAPPTAAEPMPSTDFAAAPRREALVEAVAADAGRSARGAKLERAAEWTDGRQPGSAVVPGEAQPAPPTSGAVASRDPRNAADGVAQPGPAAPSALTAGPLPAGQRSSGAGGAAQPATATPDPAAAAPSTAAPAQPSERRRNEPHPGAGQPAASLPTRNQPAGKAPPASEATRESMSPAAPPAVGAMARGAAAASLSELGLVRLAWNAVAAEAVSPPDPIATDGLAGTADRPGLASFAQVAGAGAARPVQQLALAIDRAVKGEIRQLTIQLSPQELGAVEIALELDADRRLTVAILAERPETLDLLRQDARQLERLLGQQGLGLADAAIDLGLMSEERRRGRERPPTAAPAAGIADEPAVAVAGISAPAPPASAATRRLNLSI